METVGVWRMFRSYWVSHFLVGWDILAFIRLASELRIYMMTRRDVFWILHQKFAWGTMPLRVCLLEALFHDEWDTRRSEIGWKKSTIITALGLQGLLKPALLLRVPTSKIFLFSLWFSSSSRVRAQAASFDFRCTFLRFLLHSPSPCSSQPI